MSITFYTKVGVGKIRIKLFGEVDIFFSLQSANYVKNFISNYIRHWILQWILANLHDMYLTEIVVEKLEIDWRYFIWL